MIKSYFFNKLILALDFLFPYFFNKQKFSRVPQEIKDFYSRDDFRDIIKAYHMNNYQKDGNIFIFNINDNFVNLDKDMIKTLRFEQIIIE